MGDRTIRIMLLVGSNGKASACVEGDMGWGDLADNIMDHERGRAPLDPDASSRHIVSVTVPEPAVSQISGEVSND